MIALIRITNPAANRRDFLELVPEDLPAIYGTRLPTLLRGRAVVMGTLIHKVWDVRE